MTMESVSVFNRLNDINSISAKGVKFMANRLEVERSSSRNNLHDGGAISCKNCPGFLLFNSIIKNSQGRSGGAIYLEASEDHLSGKNSEIINSTFFNCRAT